MTVEFFLVVPLIIVVTVASIQVIGIARARMEIQAAARDGARVAATSTDPAKAVEAVLDALAPALRESARVSVERPSIVGGLARVRIKLFHPVGPPFPDSMGVDLTASAAMRVER